MNNNINNINNKENFSMQPTKDVCHYSCSKLSISNILMITIIIILLYILLNKK